jgi:hypothetical protein
MEVTGKEELQKPHALCCIIYTHKITRNMVALIKENMLILNFSNPLILRLTMKLSGKSKPCLIIRVRLTTERLYRLR